MSGGGLVGGEKSLPEIVRRCPERRNSAQCRRAGNYRSLDAVIAQNEIVCDKIMNRDNYGPGQRALSRGRYALRGRFGMRGSLAPDEARGAGAGAGAGRSYEYVGNPPGKGIY